MYVINVSKDRANVSKRESLSFEERELTFTTNKMSWRGSDLSYLPRRRAMRNPRWWKSPYKVFRVKADDEFYDPHEIYEDQEEEEAVVRIPERNSTLEEFQVKKTKKKKHVKCVENKDGGTLLRRAISSDPQIGFQTRKVFKRSISDRPSVIAGAILRASRRQKRETCLRYLIVLKEERSISSTRFDALRRDLLSNETTRRDDAVRTIEAITRHRVPFYRHPGFGFASHQDEDEEDSKVDITDEIETKGQDAPMLTFSSSCSSSEEDENDEDDDDENIEDITDKIKSISKVCDEVVISTNTMPNLFYVSAKSQEFKVLFRLNNGSTPLDMLVMSSKHSKDRIQKLEEKNMSAFEFVNALLNLHSDSKKKDEEVKKTLASPTTKISNPNVESGLKVLNLLPMYSFVSPDDISSIANEKASNVLRSVVSERLAENSLLRFRALQILKESSWNISEAQSKAKSDLPYLLRAYGIESTANPTPKRHGKIPVPWKGDEKPSKRQLVEWIQTYAPDDEFLHEHRCRGKVKVVSKSRTYEYLARVCEEILAMSHIERGEEEEDVKEERTNKVLEKKLTCPCCWSTRRRSDGLALNQCGHWFCLKCWGQHIESTTVHFGNYLPTCPHKDCKSVVDPLTMMVCYFHTVKQWNTHVTHTHTVYAWP